MSEKVVNGTTAYLHPASKMVMSGLNGETSNGIHPNPVLKMAANASDGEMSSCFKPCRPVDTSASNGDTNRYDASNGDTNSHNFSSPLPEQVADLSVREKMTLYWQHHSKEASVEEMMLDTNALQLTKHDKNEVLGILPNIEDKTVLELAAGIGRFTGDLADQAAFVTVVEFMETFMKANIEANKHRENVKFLQADVTKLALEASSQDVVFSCWLLMYLSDEETQKLAENLLQWAKEGGFVFFRESCFAQSGNKKRAFNPSVYRSPQYYNALFSSVQIPAPNGGTYRFQLERCKNIDTYVSMKGNKGQLCWLWKKVWDDTGHGGTMQTFLDSQQYTLKGILRYEKVFGEGYVSSGGPDTTREFVKSLNLRPGDRVLDLGCGIGGGDFYMAEEYSAVVHAIDLSVNMVSIALERAVLRPKEAQVSFDICDATMVEFPESSFDVIYTRDTLLHIVDKPRLFRNCWRWLHPGGQVLISDYCRGEGEGSEEFKAYVAQRQYDLRTVKEYGHLLEEAGFEAVNAQDRTEQFTAILQSELERFIGMKEEFLQDFSQEDFDAVVLGWQAKMTRSRQGHQCWGLFHARKPQ